MGMLFNVILSFHIYKIEVMMSFIERTKNMKELWACASVPYPKYGDILPLGYCEDYVSSYMKST